MKLVIDVPYDQYVKICAGDFDTSGYFKLNLRNAFRNGTPLPKGHGRLKDVDWIDDNYHHCYADDDGSWAYRWEDINNAPTIIEADKNVEAEEAE